QLLFVITCSTGEAAKKLATAMVVIFRRSFTNIGIDIYYADEFTTSRMFWQLRLCNWLISASNWLIHRTINNGSQGNSDR
ncbi:hypothetical protein, partial [Onishia niordana]|uniref:hypothetical protein n=1 Tax=Onishia niordana TaxID=2508711 RepID=UPI00197ABF4D